jgi:hypothetical protein
MNSGKNTARLAGLLWFLTAVTAGFSLVYVRPKLIVLSGHFIDDRSLRVSDQYFYKSRNNFGT